MTFTWEGRSKPLEKVFGGSGRAQTRCAERQNVLEAKYLSCIREAVTAMAAAIITFPSVLGTCRKVGTCIRGSLWCIIGIYVERSLDTVWSCTRKAGTPWWSEGPPLWRKSGKDAIWGYVRKHTVQPGKPHLHWLSSVSLGKISEHETDPKLPDRCRLQTEPLDLTD